MKRGQMKLSFGMIFSIILIIVFLVFAFYAIKTFLGVQRSAETGKFLNDLQSDINRIWRSEWASEEQDPYSLPSKIEYICFVDFSISEKGQNSGFYDELEKFHYQSENLVFYPIGSSEIDPIGMENIDIISITQDENPFCIKNINGKIQVTLIKDFQDSLVTITR